LPKKLGIKDGSRLALLASPTGFTRKLAPLPARRRDPHAGARQA